MHERHWQTLVLRFLISLSVSALAFFLSSYQVHEKSILLPLLPITLLAGEVSPPRTRVQFDLLSDNPSNRFASCAQEPSSAWLLGLVSNFSMFPLLSKDGLGIPYIVLSLLLLACPSVGLVDTREARPEVTGGVIGGLLVLHTSALLVCGRKKWWRVLR